MGTLHYSSKTFGMDDRQLIHLQAAVTQRLRNLESFMLLLQVGSDKVVSVWIDRSIPMLFDYAHVPLPQLNVAWVNQIVEQDAQFGVTLGDEPSED